ncbi:hypothetical protein DFH09DRAFT_1092554 [Mycena vulgaris]|nr:hypothetical protein DFH09DRAFT_1092554 [Mycena vulgaris]
MTLQITLNFANIQGLLLNRLQHQNPAAVDTLYCIIYLNGFSRLAGHGHTPLMDHIAHIQPLPSGLEVPLIAEIFNAQQYHPIPNPAVLIEQAIKQLPHFDEPDVKCLTGRFYNALGVYYQYSKVDLPTATNYYQTGLSLAISTGNTKRQCQSSIGLAGLRWRMGDPAAGQIYASEAQRLAKITADLYQEAQALEIEARCWARDLLVHCGMSASGLENRIMGTQAEIYKLKSEYVEARDIRRQILAGAPVELEPYFHALTLLNIAEVEVFLDVPMEDVERKIDTAKSILNSSGYVGHVMACDAAMGALHLRKRNQPSAKPVFHKCLSFFWGQSAEMVNYCLERLGDRSLWGSTNWSSSWTIVYFVHASKSQQKLDVHKALQFLGDIFCTEGDQDTAISLLKVALDGFTYMDVHHSQAKCMLQLGYISKDNGDMLKATEYWRSARSLFERASQVKQIALIDEELLSITGDVHGEYTRSLTLLSDIHAPNAALETTAGSLVEEIGETENLGLGEGEELVPVLV